MSIETFKLDNTLTRLVSFNLKTPRIAPMLLGEAAIGKTSWVRNLAEHNGCAAFTINVNTLADKADVTATQTLRDEDGNVHQEFFPMKKVRDANDYALAHPDTPVIIHLDEINRTDPDVASAIQTMITDRTNGDLKLADNIRFIVSGNDHGNIVELDSASISRFALYSVVPDADVFMDIMGDKLNPYIHAVLTNNPDLILCKPLDSNVTAEVDVDGNPVNSNGSNDDDDSEVFNFEFGEGNGMRQFTAPRTLEGLNDTLNQIDRNTFIELLSEEIGRGSNVLYQMIVAHVGETEFAEKIAVMIADDVTTSNTPDSNGTPTIDTPAKPLSWDKFGTAVNRDDIVLTIDALSPTERGDLFLYTIFNQRDRTITADKIAEVVMDAMLQYKQSSDFQLGNRGLRMMLNLAANNLIDTTMTDKVCETVNENSALAELTGQTLSILQN